MHRIDTSTAAPGGFFTEGDPTVPTAATRVSADFLNALQQEMCAVIEGAGLALNKADNTQLLQALNVLAGRQRGRQYFLGQSS